MKFLSNAIFLAFVLFLMAACGGEANSTAAQQKKKDAALETVKEKEVKIPEDALSPSGTEMASEIDLPDEEVSVEEINTENVENPQPVKVSSPVQKQAKEEVPPPPVKEKVESPKAEVNIAPPVVEETVETELPPPPVEEEIMSPPVEEVISRTSTITHAAWDKLLRSNVTSSGKVNYRGFKASKVALESYLRYLSDNPIQNSWPRNKKMAYWINAYNAFTVKLIVDNYPISSITELHGGKPWDVKWIKLGGKTYSLNQIENDILRPQYKDARIHFAVNCAAKSCPPLLNRAWTASNLNSNLEKQAKAFINNAQYNAIQADKIEISKIFDWYGEDFGNIVTYLNKYAGTSINKNAKVSYKEYNWKLNQ